LRDRQPAFERGLAALPPAGGPASDSLTCLCVPLLSGSDVHGVLELFFVGAHELDDLQVSHYRALARQIGAAISRTRLQEEVRETGEQLRMLSQYLLGAIEGERRSIARELHDEVGQALTAAQINLRDLERRAEDRGLAQQAGEVSAIIGNVLKQVRQLSLDLHPSVLEDLGLAAAVRWTIRERAARSGLEIALALEEDLPRYAAVVETTIFRVFQEALSNVLRHARARHLTVALAEVGEWLELAIEDDGCGFDPEAARKRALERASLGMISMQERTRLGGGQMSIRSTPGSGTLLELRLPARRR
jgi:signal transduction histidine kinase